MARPISLLLPVGGAGTRLRPHTYTCPKPLLRIGGQAMLGHGLDRFLRDLADDIAAYVFITPPGAFGQQFVGYIRMVYVTEPIHLRNAPADLPQRRARLVEHAHFVAQPQARGQADALWCARDIVAELSDDTAALVFFPDTIFEADLSHLRNLADDGAIFYQEVSDPRAFGVAVADANGYVTQVVEKPETWVSNKAIVSPTYFRSARQLYEAIEKLRDKGAAGLRKGEYYLADAMSIMIEEAARFTTRAVDQWVDCGTPQALIAANRYILERSALSQKPVARHNSVIAPPVWIDPHATLNDCVIGPYVSIGNCHIEASVIRDTLIEDGAVVENVIVANSIIGRDAHIFGKPLHLNIGDSAVYGRNDRYGSA